MNTTGEFSGRDGASSRVFLDATALHSELAEAGFNAVEVVGTTTSTNTVLADQVRKRGGKIADFSALLAEEQTQGRGRLDRAWGAPKSSQLIMSVAVRLPGFNPNPSLGEADPGRRIGLLPLLTGVAVASAIRRFSEKQGQVVPVTLKWPNDVQVDGRKLAGILVEAVQLDPVPIVVIGVGLNYDLSREELPVPHATSLALERMTTNGEGTRTAVASAILQELKEHIETFRTAGGNPETVLPRYRELSATLGTQVRVHLPDGTVPEGQATAIDDSGELIVATDDVAGGKLVVAAGDVTHLRPAKEGR